MSKQWFQWVMSKYFGLFIGVMVCMLLPLTMNSIYGQVNADENVNSSKQKNVEVKVVEQDKNHTRIEIRVNNYQIDDVENNGAKYHRITVPGLETLSELSTFFA